MEGDNQKIGVKTKYRSLYGALIDVKLIFNACF